MQREREYCHVFSNEFPAVALPKRYFAMTKLCFLQHRDDKHDTGYINASHLESPVDESTQWHYIVSQVGSLASCVPLLPQLPQQVFADWTKDTASFELAKLL